MQINIQRTNKILLPSLTSLYLLLSFLFINTSQQALAQTIENLYINEFMASNSIGITDEFGEYEDWIEIYNANSFAVNLAGLYITDDLAVLDKWQFPSTNAVLTNIPAGGYIIIWADKDSLQSELHTNFKLSSLGEDIALVEDDDGDLVIIDELTFASQTNDVSYGHYPDASGSFEFFTEPTPNATNMQSSTNNTFVEGLFINELLASNISDITDNTGVQEDWVEIYNSNSFPVDIGGLYVTDDWADKTIWRIPTIHPDSTTIPANGFMVLWADRDTDEGVRHVRLGLGERGERFGLVQVFNNDTLFIDSLSFPRQGEDISYGRLPDGSTTTTFFKSSTPDASNNNSEEVVFANIKVYLEGAYNANNGLMDTNLVFKQLLAPQHPFNQAPWNYNGQESLQDTIDHITGTIDWLLVEARDANNNNLILEQRVAILLMDGSVIDGTGIQEGIAFFNVAANTDYYLSVKSRNHLAVLGQNLVTLPNTTPYDFTDANNITGGTGQVSSLTTNLNALKAGDFNADGVITVTDFNLFTTQVAAINQYLASDANYDGNVTVVDFNHYRPNVSAIGVSQIRYQLLPQ